MVVVATVSGLQTTPGVLLFEVVEAVEFGFQEVYIYSGGLFEWLLLQDIYSENEFPTTSKVQDFLFYKPRPLFHIQRLK